MKKFLTIIFALFCMTMMSQAQAILSESFDSGSLPTGWTVTDADGDTYNWDAASPVANGFTPHTGAGLISSASYVNSVGALTPNNWLISPQITIPSGGATLTFWVAAQDATYAGENYAVYISSTGNTPADFTTTLFTETLTSNPTMRTPTPWVQRTVNITSANSGNVYIAFRHFNCTDMFWLNLDDVEISAAPTTPTIVAAPTTLNFGIHPIGSTAELTSVVTGYVLTAGITATTTAPFAVSADGTTYGTTATLATTGGTLYVSYAPTAATTSTGTVTLSSTGATDLTINLTGEGVDCSAAISTLPWTENFSGAVFPPLCWELESTNATTWTTYEFGESIYASIVVDEAGAAQDEWLITKTFDFSNYNNTILMDMNLLLQYTYIVTNELCNFLIYASTNGGNSFGTTPIWDARSIGVFPTYSNFTATVDLSSLAGESNVKLAFVYQGTGGAQVLFTDLSMYNYEEPIIIDNEESYTFYTEVNTNEDVTTQIFSYNLESPLTATTAAPFSVSADGTTFGTTATLNADGALYIRYTGVLGTQTGVVTLSSTSATDVTIALSAEGYDCSALALPLEQGFDMPSCPPGCWSIVYGNNDPTINPMRHLLYEEGGTDRVFAFSSYNTTDNYDQYLISPEIPFDGATAVMFNYFTYGQAETFRVGYSTTTNDVASFTWLYAITTSATSAENAFFQIPAGAKYVAINYTSEYMYYLYVDNFELVEYTGIDEVSMENTTMVYPNPAKDVINVTAASNINSIEVYSITGQLLISENGNDMQSQINVSELANGIYMMKISTEDGVINKKFNVAK